MLDMLRQTFYSSFRIGRERCSKPPWYRNNSRSLATMTATTPQYRSIAELQKVYRAGSTTVKEVTQQYLAAIDGLNGDVNAVTAVNKHAVEQAERLDGVPQDQRGPLFGVPMVLKDQIETAGIPTAYGSLACEDYVPPKDATIVTKLKAAGVVIRGKSTMPDWAAGWLSTSSLSGTTKHPIDHTRDPGGSSSGSGTAVATDMALAAIGGDTGGSIRLPASFCGLVGVRVTPGRISRDGMSSLVKTQDTPGPMVKTVDDAARLLDVLVGFDENERFHLHQRRDWPNPLTHAIRRCHRATISRR